jgi:hypothetical protein
VSTYKGYCNTKRKLYKFLAKNQIQDDFDSIDLRFYDQFVQFLFSSPYEFSLNNVGKHIQNLKTVLNSAVSDGICTNLKFKHTSFKKLKQKTSHIYLTLQELESIRKTQFDSLRLSNARDLLLILCFTGLRYYDLYKVSISRQIKLD